MDRGSGPRHDKWKITSLVISMHVYIGVDQQVLHRRGKEGPWFRSHIQFVEEPCKGRAGFN